MKAELTGVFNTKKNGEECITRSGTFYITLSFRGEDDEYYYDQVYLTEKTYDYRIKKLYNSAGLHAPSFEAFETVSGATQTFMELKGRTFDVEYGVRDGFKNIFNYHPKATIGDFMEKDETPKPEPKSEAQEVDESWLDEDEEDDVPF